MCCFHCPLYGAQAYTKLSSNLTERSTFLTHSITYCLVIDLFHTTFVDALGFRFSYAFSLAFFNHAAFKLGYSTHHGQHEFLCVVLLTSEQQFFLVELDTHACFA
ncbi:hypothetical protein D3C81_1872200 [compost metagenome]